MTSQCRTVRPLNKNSPTCSLLTLASWRESHLLSDHKWGWQVRSLYCYKTHQSWRWMQAAWVKHCSATNKQMNKKYFVSSLSLPVIFCITYTHKNLQDKISSWLKVTFYHNLQLNGLSTVLQICTISSISGPLQEVLRYVSLHKMRAIWSFACFQRNQSHLHELVLVSTDHSYLSFTLYAKWYIPISKSNVPPTRAKILLLLRS